MRRIVHLHGYDNTAGPIEVVAKSVWEAVEAATYLFKALQPDGRNGRKRIMVAGHTSRESLLGHSDVTDIHIFPAMSFGKNGGLIQTVIGVALIIAGTALILTGTPAWGIPILLSGLTSAAGGLMQLIAPQPKATPEIQSRYIATTQNTVQIGTPIPILYGRFLVGGQILSLSVTSQNQQFKST